MAHPSDMTAWTEIRCQRGHADHAVRSVRVDLARRHAYADYAQVPKRIARAWTMLVWDALQHPVDGGPYCPAHDAVSETILATGIWEPPETILVAEVLSSEPGLFVDLGCQIGWYSMLALACGARVIALDADEANLRLATLSAAKQSHHGFEAVRARIGVDAVDLGPLPIRLAKIDVEGAEALALDVLAPSLGAGTVDHLLIEVTPTFKPGDHYPDLVCGLRDRGYEVALVPPKALPPASYHDPEQYLDRIDPLGDRALRDVIGRCGQAMVWFRREGASW